jgi:hypothetical protein
MIFFSFDEGSFVPGPFPGLAVGLAARNADIAEEPIGQLRDSQTL